MNANILLCNMQRKYDDSHIGNEGKFNETVQENCTQGAFLCNCEL